MIKLSRASPPGYLSAQKTLELTDEFKRSGAAVWNHIDIKGALLQSSHGKCAYCEAKLSEESKYLEVEHFEDKGRNPDKVVDWNNLLPACKRCNVRKGSHDVTSDPIVNPFDVEPVKHLGFKSYRLRGISGLGSLTIDVLDLNNSVRVVSKRFEIGEAIAITVENALARYAAWQVNATTRSKNLLLGVVEGLLLECQDNAAYAATAATSLHGDSRYQSLVTSMKSIGLWSVEMEALHVRSEQLSLT